jgi:uncharacterized protein YndB with AHSA1/START domain
MSTRSQTHSVEVRAGAAALWDAVSTGPGLERWWAPQARVTPGVGGEVWASWGPECEGSMRISVWEPERRLQVSDERPGGRMTVDFFVEPLAEGSTRLRLVQDGFGTGPESDAEYESTERGWQVFMLTLAHGLEHNVGLPAFQISPTRLVRIEPGAAMEWVLSPEALCAEGTLRGVQAGERFRIRTVDGDELMGVVQRARWPHLVVTLASHGNGLLALFADPHRGKSLVTLMLVGYGDHIPAVRALGERWEKLLAKLPE